MVNKTFIPSIPQGILFGLQINHELLIKKRPVLQSQDTVLNKTTYILLFITLPLHTYNILTLLTFPLTSQESTTVQ